ncbi:MAG: hypothetical protein H7146_00770 [Burkholderiaceae bacterium]|nr:hypothetical protein [Microbacteriaceae bacterium]
MSLDGVEANLTRVTSDAATTQTKTLIVGFAPTTYTTATNDDEFFVISVVIPDGSGDQLIHNALDSWRWM